MKKLLPVIFFILCYSQQLTASLLTNLPMDTGNPSITWFVKPVNMQLFARESNDSADVTISGSVNSPGYDSFFVELYKNRILITRKSQPLIYVGTVAGFSITDKIRAELSEYSTKAYLKDSSENVLINTADSLVAGDVYLIMGQSNAQTADTNVTFSSEYCRTFGVQTPNTNQNSYLRKDTLWAKSSAKYNGYTPITQQQPYNVCVWGIWLQKYIKDSCSIPTCVINGAVHSSGINLHLRKNSNPTDSSTIYGKTLYRVQKSSLAEKVKTIFWYQGESDVVSPSYSTYANKFDSLYNSWKIDYPGVEKIFVMQVRPLACNGLSGFAQELRETQRRLQDVYPDIQVIATVGISGYDANPPSNNCHFQYTGYQQLAGILFKRVGQLYYGAPDTEAIRSPSIRKAWFTNEAKNKIGMLFDGSAPAYIPTDSLGNSIRNYFYLDKVAGFTSGIISSVTRSGDTLFLNLSSSYPATFLSYIPDIFTSDGFTIYNGPWLRNSRGLGVLTFDLVPISDPEPDSMKINIRIIPEGMYSPSYNQLTRQDSITAYLRLTVPPYDKIDSAKAVIDSISFTGLFKFSPISSGTYYISVSHFNTIETWSKDGGENIVNDGSIYNYDFTNSSTQAYGNNLIFEEGMYCIYSGDVNQSGDIDLNDIISIYNDSQNFVSGSYVNSDLNGDSFVNLLDLSICFNNSQNFVKIAGP